MKKILIPLLQNAKKVIYILEYNILKNFTSIEENKIVLASNRGTILKENLLWINEKLKQEKKYEIKILLTDKLSFAYSFNFIKNIANAKYTIIDDFFPLVYPLKIRKGAKLIQVWHALGAFKRVGFSRLGKVGGPSPKSITHKNYTDVVVSSESIVDNYAEAFQIAREKIHPLGVARTDFFFDNAKKEQAINKIYNMYPILKNKRVILFAPTFRGNGKKSAYYPEKYFNINKIYENLDENEVLIIKNHPFIKKQMEISEKYANKVIDLTNYSEINELLLITDILITDYSSTIFEYALLDKPIIYYVPDLEEYKKTRDFYYNFEEYIFGEICKTQDELIQSLRNIQLDKEKLKIFKEKFLNKCDGNSTERFIKKIIKES